MNLHCPHCNKDVQIADNLASIQLRCPSCRKLIDRPQPQPVAAAAAAPQAAARPAVGGAPASAPRQAAPTNQGVGPRPSGPSAQGTAPRPGAAPAQRPAAAARAPGVTGSVQATYRPLLEAVALAARAHKNQLRKDDKTPYVSHVFRVLLIVRHVFGVEDPQALMAAVLHDTLEDTTTDWDDIHQFSDDVGNFVAVLTKDKRRPEAKREEIYRGALGKAPWQVQVCKLADIFDNLLDSVHIAPDQRKRTIDRLREYLKALGAELQEPARRPHEIVSQLLAEIEAGKSG